MQWGALRLKRATNREIYAPSHNLENGRRCMRVAHVGVGSPRAATERPIVEKGLTAMQKSAAKSVDDAGPCCSGASEG